MEYYYSGHGVYYTSYHIVFVTKYRRKALSPGFAKYADTVIRNIVNGMDGVIIQELNVQPDHVHLVIIIPPRYNVSKIVEAIKSVSAKIVRKKFNWLNKVYYGTPSLWSVGYFVSTVGVNENVIRKYVKYQQGQDSYQAKLDFGQ